MHKLSIEEKGFLDSVIRGEWKTVANLEKEKRKAVLAARETLRKIKHVKTKVREKEIDKNHPQLKRFESQKSPSKASGVSSGVI
jgi:hypothetical protein